MNRPRTNPRAWQRAPNGRPFLAGRIEARSMLAGRTNPALAGSGVGCELAGRTRPVGTQTGAASWPSPHMSKNHSFSGPPPFRVSLTYARGVVGSTDFAPPPSLLSPPAGPYTLGVRTRPDEAGAGEGSSAISDNGVAVQPPCARRRDHNRLRIAVRRACGAVHGLCKCSIGTSASSET